MINIFYESAVNPGSWREDLIRYKLGSLANTDEVIYNPLLTERDAYQAYCSMLELFTEAKGKDSLVLDCPESFLTENAIFAIAEMIVKQYAYGDLPQNIYIISNSVVFYMSLVFLMMQGYVKEEQVLIWDEPHKKGGHIDLTSKDKLVRYFHEYRGIIGDIDENHNLTGQWSSL